ncbi:hypothetical protein ACUSIJ_08140 [Pseudochelatococcus sp. B33]
MNGRNDDRDDEEGVSLTPEERRRQRVRNIAIGVALGALFILFYILTIARLGSNVFNRPL